MRLSLFLTAYDPSDVPRSSVDPRGFDRGYWLLAEEILPGRTNVASRPRYLSALCAGVYLSDGPGGDNEHGPARTSLQVAA